MISVAQAITIVTAETQQLEAERVPLSNAVGRFLREDIVADSDLPPFDRAQMDGYAVRAEDVAKVPARLRIVGESAAGSGWHKLLKAGEAVRIMTGAPVPAGADSVQQVEFTRETDGTGEVEILQPVEQGRSIVKRATEIRAGEQVLNSGERITSTMLAVFASFGYAKVLVAKQPRVAVLSTGSELVAVQEKPGRDQIRDSNNFSISAYAEAAGATVERLPLAGDDTQLLMDQIRKAAERSDVVITSGGVSMGVYDFTKTALRELNAEIFFERIALRPGKPMVFGRLPGGALIFGLPGNPVSVSVTFNLFARTSINLMQGSARPSLTEDWAVLAKTVKSAKERDSYLPAQIRTNSSGQLLAEPLKWGGSSDFVAFARASALIIVPADQEPIQPGSIVKILHLP